jgi:hypothetical protein
MNLRMAAAALLLEESQVRYYTAPVKMHNKCALVLHNSALGDVYMAGDVRDNPIKPKVLNYESFFSFFSYCISLLGDGVHLYNFGKNKKAARDIYAAYKRNGGRLPFKANLVNSSGDIVFSGNDEPLFQANASLEERKYLARESRMFIDNYRSTRSRGKNLPDFHLSIADGNGRANFDRFFDYVAAINRATGIGVAMGELLDYNRARAVSQAMLRTPRDDRHKHLIIYNGDMSMFDVPDYLRNRVVLAEDIYRDYFEGTRTKRFEELKERFNPDSHEAAQMVALAGYFDEMVNGPARPAPAALPEVEPLTNPVPGADAFSAFRHGALLIPSVSVDLIKHLETTLRGNNVITHEDRQGRKADWLAALKLLVEAGLLVKSKKGYDTIFTIPVEKPESEVPESEENPNV